MIRMADVAPYLNLGWQLHPAHTVVDGVCTCRKGKDCPGPGTHPRSKNGVHDATDKEEKWSEWITKTKGVINIQLACGEKSGVTVIDVDAGRGGLEALAEIQQNVMLPETPSARSGGGGLHFFFAYHPLVTTTQDVVAPGMETKSGGTSIHLPPSMHRSGNQYKWLHAPWEVPLAKMPAWIVDIFRARAEAEAELAQKTVIPGSDFIDQEEAYRRAEAWLIRVDPAIEGKGGRIATFKAALGLVRGFGLDETRAWSLFSTIYNPRCDPPWSEKDLREKLRQAGTRSRQPLGYLYFRDRQVKRAPSTTKKTKMKEEDYFATPEMPLDDGQTPLGDEVKEKDDNSNHRVIKVIPGFDDSPVVDECIVPPGFELSTGGVGKHVSKDGGRTFTTQWFTSTPIVVSAVTKDPVDGSTFIRMCCRTRAVDGKSTWQQKMVALDTVSSRSKVEKLSRYGAEITSWNAREVSEYIHAFMRVNQVSMPMANAARHLGWQKGGGFFWGEKLIKGGHVIKVDDKDVTKWGKHAVIFSETDDSLSELSSCYRGRGHIQKWKESLAVLCDESPYLRLAILASFAAPMLEVMARKQRHVQNFVVDFANTTSTGKTTLLRCAASVWGNPFDHDDTTGLIASWGATKSFIERTAAVRSHLPIFLDDTKRARAGLVPEIVYMVANGHGDGRASIGGVQEKRRFRTVLISTGEMRIVDFSEDGGTRGRTMQMWGAPFGKPTEEMAKKIGAALAAVQQNHGQVGPAFIRWITSIPKGMDKWMARYDKHLERYSMVAGKVGALQRQAPIFALLELVESMLDACGLLPWERKTASPIEALYAQLRSTGMEADRSLAAFDHLRGVVMSQRSRLYTGISREEPLHGWLGKWEDNKNVFLFPHAVKRILKEGGFEAPAVLKQWADAQVVKPDEKQLSRVTRMIDKAARMIEFPMSMWDEDIPKTLPSPEVVMDDETIQAFAQVLPVDIEQSSFDFLDTDEEHFAYDPRSDEEMRKFHAATESEIIKPVQDIPGMDGSAYDDEFGDAFAPEYGS